MSLKTSRIAALAVALAAAGAMSVAASASAYTIHFQFRNWVVSGTVTPKKLNEPITLPKGSTFNGEAEVSLSPFGGPITGNIFVPPFTATMKILGVPESVGITLTQAGKIEGQLAFSASQTECPRVSEQQSYCETLIVPTKVNMTLTMVGALGINVPTTCETSEPITLDAVDTLTQYEIFHGGPHFTGTTTLPPIICHGIDGLVLGPVLTTLISGPDNAFVLNLAEPAKT